MYIHNGSNTIVDCPMIIDTTLLWIAQYTCVSMSVKKPKSTHSKNAHLEIYRFPFVELDNDTKTDVGNVEKLTRS